jgi:hypothetical protein
MRLVVANLDQITLFPIRNIFARTLGIAYQDMVLPQFMPRDWQEAIQFVA